VVPGTNPKTNKQRLRHDPRDTLFTNVALTADNEPWWEGLERRHAGTDWQGRPYDPKNGPGRAPECALHRQRRVAEPGYSPGSREPAGVPISAIVFGGRRREVAPLVYEARDWAARRAGRRLGGLGNHRRRHRRRWAWCAATRWR
jgi:phosphoenolpyruvate carboxykinase (GTP)